MNPIRVLRSGGIVSYVDYDSAGNLISKRNESRVVLYQALDMDVEL